MRSFPRASFRALPGTSRWWLPMLIAGLAIPAAAAARPAPVDATAELLVAVNSERRAAGLESLRPEPALAAVAARSVSEALTLGLESLETSDAQDISRQMRGAGYQVFSWRRRVVLGPADAEAVLGHWRDSDPTTFAEIVFGDFEGLGAARVDADAPLWALFVALPRRTTERRLAAPLDDLEAVRSLILGQVNAERTARGLPSLAAEPRLAAAAQGHASDMLARSYYDHHSPEGDGPAERAAAAGYRWRAVAENIAKGLFQKDEVVERWMESSGHRRNILEASIREVGVGVAWGEDRDGHVVALWVLLLAAPG
jgi:uncharacterized protein YkwD